MKIYTYILLVFLFFTCCSEKTKETHPFFPTDSINNKINTICLNENLDFLGNTVSDFLIFNDSTYLISTPFAVYIYSKKGVQIRTIGEQGEGPDKYLNIGEVCLTENYVYIWCQIKQRLFVYDREGTYLTTYPLPRRMIISMCVYQDRYLCCMLDGSHDNKIIEIYDLYESESLRSVSLYSKETRLLSCAQTAGDIEIRKNILYWSIPSELSLYSLDLNNINGKILQYNFYDEDFIVKKLNKKDGLYDGQKILEYINSNSRIIQLSFHKENIFIVTETGTIKQSKQSETDKSSKRFVKIYQINKDKKLTNMYMYNISANYGFTKLTNDTFYLLRAEETLDDFRIILDEYSLR